MNTTQITWTIGNYSYVVTATADEIVSVRLSVATVATDAAKREFFRGFDGDQEEAFFAAVDESLAAAIALPVAA